MKSKFLGLLLCLLAGMAAHSQIRNLQLQAAGLTCSMCSNAIDKALRSLPQVADIQTNLDQNLFVISLRDGETVSFDDVKNKVEEAGFSVGKLTAEVHFPAMTTRQDAHVKVAGMLLHILKSSQPTVEGWQTVQVLDKSFVLDKQFKKLQQQHKVECLKTGKAAECCTGAQAGERVYHIGI
jgi:copper chaperone CopZ